MDNAIGVAVNSSGSSTPVASDNSYTVFYHFSLPAEAEWQQINGVITSSGIKYNNWSGVPYWTATTRELSQKYIFRGRECQKTGQEMSRIVSGWYGDIIA